MPPQTAQNNDEIGSMRIAEQVNVFCEIPSVGTNARSCPFPEASPCTPENGELDPYAVHTVRRVNGNPPPPPCRPLYSVL